MNNLKGLIFLGMLCLFVAAPFNVWGKSPVNPVKKVVEANEFKLVDFSGNIRAIMSYVPNVGPSMALLDDNEEPRIVIGYTDNIAGIEIRDSNGKKRLSAKVSAKGDSFIYLRSPKDKNNVMLSAFHDNGSMLSLDNSNQTVSLRVEEGDGAKVLLHENKNQFRGGLALIGGKPQLWLKGKTPKSGAVLMVENDDVPNLRMMNSEGETQLVLAARKPGPGLFLRDKGGKTRAGLYHHDGVGSYLQLSRHNGTVATALSASQKSGANLTFADEQNGGRMAIGHSKKGLSYIHLDDKTHQPRYIMAVTNDGGAISKMIHPDGSEIANIITPDGKPYSAISRRGVNMWSIPDTGASIPENTLPGVPGGGMNWDDILGGAVQ